MSPFATPTRAVSGRSPPLLATPRTSSAGGTNDGAARNLALSLLLDTLGEAALCPACKGTEWVVYQTESADVPQTSPFVAWTCDVDPDPARLAACPNPHCAGGRVLPVLPVEELTDQVIALLPAHRQWTITRPEVVAWAEALANPPT